ncbi:MAG: hypothetical protein AAF732_01175 [Pseudomonadota bacterium]
MNRENRNDMAELARMLDAYGADPARWPTAVRARFGDDLARDPEIVQRVAAERHFEHLLSHAETQPVPVGLTDRIMARATAELDGPDGVVRGRETAQPVVVRMGTTQHAGRAVAWFGNWAGAVALGVCLTFGVYVGVDGMSLPAIETLAQTLGLENQVVVLLDDHDDWVVGGTL